MAFFSRTSKRTHIVLDLGSHFIKTAIFEKPVAGGVIPLNIRKIVTKLRQGSRSSHTFEYMQSSIHSVMNRQEKVPEKIIIGIGPHFAEISLQEWNMTLSHLREPLTVSHMKAYFQQLFDEHRERDHAFLVYPLSMDINGYHVDVRRLSSYNVPDIKEITFHAIMLRFSDQSGSIIGNLIKAFAGIPMEFVPLQAVVGEALAETHAINEALLIDIGRSGTALTFLHHGVVTQLNSFPLGTERFSHRIMKTRGGKFFEAEDMNRQYSQGLISRDEQANLSHVFSKESTEWKIALMKSLEIFYPIAPIPQELYIYGGGSYIPEVRSALWTSDGIKNFSSASSLAVHIVQAPQIFHDDPLGGAIRGPEDVGLASLMYYSLSHTPLFP